MHLSNLCMICLVPIFFFFCSVFYFCRMFKKSCLSAFDLKTINTQSWSFQPLGLGTCILHRLFWVNSQKVLYLTIILVHVPKYWILGIFFIRYVNSHWLCQSKTFHTQWSYMYTLTVITTFLHSVFTWYQYTFTYICITITLFYWCTRPGPHLPVLGADNQDRPLVVRAAG